MIPYRWLGRLSGYGDRPTFALYILTFLVVKLKDVSSRQHFIARENGALFPATGVYFWSRGSGRSLF